MSAMSRRELLRIGPGIVACYFASCGNEGEEKRLYTDLEAVPFIMVSMSIRGYNPSANNGKIKVTFDVDGFQPELFPDVFDIDNDFYAEHKEPDDPEWQRNPEYWKFIADVKSKYPIKWAMTRAGQTADEIDKEVEKEHARIGTKKSPYRLIKSEGGIIYFERTLENGRLIKELEPKNDSIVVRYVPK